MADQAINDLKSVGFNNNQIRYFGPGATSGSSGNFFDDLKNWFTGQDATSGSVTNDFADMGISNEEAQYYSNEYKNGHPVLVVHTRDHQREALDILHRYGAYDYNMAGTSYAKQPSNNVQPGGYVPPAANPPMNQPGTQPPIRQQVTNAAQPDGLQELQAQLQSTQAQLRDAQAQLQAAREHETQLRAAKERDTQVQSMRKQLQDAQAQLQATQAELRATQERIAKANQ